MKQKGWQGALAACSVLAVVPGCSGAAELDSVQVPEKYAFESRFEPGESSVSYSGQTLRQVLIADLKAYIGGLTEDIDSGQLMPTPGDIRSGVDFYYDFDGATSGDQKIGVTTDPAPAASVYNDISSGKSLKEKFAGNDPVGQHKDWSQEFVGWKDSSVKSAESLLVLWFDQLEQAGMARANGMLPKDPDGKDISKVFVTDTGLDLQQLTQKFLGGALAFSQGVDDYLDDSEDGKGLLADNDKAAGMGKKPYTELEHAWDEAFGYFGAARDYADYTDDEIAGKAKQGPRKSGYYDTDGDGRIDLASEVNFGHSVNAAKRDRGSSDKAPTDYTKQAFDAFLRGRAIIASAAGPLSSEEMTELKAQRDIGVDVWERAISATTVHYINDVLVDMSKAGTPDYDFYDHAKHWSELKGFALAPQFNPRSPLSDRDFATIHAELGDAPVLPGGKLDDYRKSLLKVRELIGNAYGFDAANLGDDQGMGGW